MHDSQFMYLSNWAYYLVEHAKDLIHSEALLKLLSLSNEISKITIFTKFHCVAESSFSIV